MTRLVALVHGWGGSYDATYRAHGWEEALQQAGLTPFAIDLPGHGPSGGSHNPADYADLASGLDALLPEGVWACVGFSLGTKLLLELEIRQPGRFGRLVLGGIGDNIFAPEAQTAQLVRALRGEVPLEHAPAGVQALIAYSRKSDSDPECLAAILERPPNPQITPQRLAAIRSKILLVNSRDDAVAMPDGRLRNALPNAEYLEIEDATHISLASDMRFREAVIDYLSAQPELNFK